jgi:hypothetical protein
MSLDVQVMEIVRAFAEMKAPSKVKDEAALNYINGLSHPHRPLIYNYVQFYFKAKQHWREEQEYIRHQGLIDRRDKTGEVE